MSEIYYQPVDFSEIAVENFVIETLSTFPITPASSRMIWYTGALLQGPGLYIWNGTNWVLCSASMATVILNQYNHVQTTYSNLQTLISGNSLEPGVYYIITDYQTHWLINGSPTFSVYEPLMVLALDFNKITNIAYSTLYPEDTIIYDFTYSLANPKGRILKRTDNIKRISAYYDWRNITFRRWNIDGLETTGTYTAWATTVNLGNASYIVPNILDFEDRLTFNDALATGFNDVYIGELDTATQLIVGSRNNNIVFNSTVNANNIYIGPNSYFNSLVGTTYQNIKFKSDLHECIFLQNCINSEFDNICKKNYFKGSITLTNIESNCYDNELYSMLSNNISSDFNTNLIDNNFNNNKIKNNFNTNTINTNFSFNQIDDNFSTNTININFSENNIGKDCFSNIIGINFKRNDIGRQFQGNSIFDSFQDNRVSNGFQSNTTLASLLRCKFDLDDINGMSLPAISFNDKSISSLGSTFNIQISTIISNELDLTGYFWAGTFDLNFTNSINKIIDGPFNFPIKLQVNLTQVVTLNGTPAGTAVIDQIILPSATIIFNGNNGDWITLIRDSSGRLKQLDGQNYI